MTNNFIQGCIHIDIHNRYTYKDCIAKKLDQLKVKSIGWKRRRVNCERLFSTGVLP